MSYYSLPSCLRVRVRYGAQGKHSMRSVNVRVFEGVMKAFRQGHHQTYPLLPDWHLASIAEDGTWVLASNDDLQETVH